MHDVLIEGGVVVTATDTVQADIAIRDGRIAAVGLNLGAARTRIDARGKMVMPGGVDTHCHVEQISGAGLMNADTFESATRSALYGGTTSIVSFAAQHPGKPLRGVVDAYQALAAKGALIDHAFHMIVSDISGDNLSRDIPELIAEGHRSIKIFTTYDKVRLADEAILDVLWAAKAGGALVCFHGENDGLIRWMTRRLLESGRTEARFHPLSHPAPPRSRRCRASASSPNSRGSRSCCSTSRPARASRSSRRRARAAFRSWRRRARTICS
jgi:dihydropyrimidinase